jgi:preprotein translocase subunit SecB
MTDVDAGTAPPAEPTAPQIRILTQFTRDLSFESPRAPDSLRGTAQPEIEIGVELNARGRPDSYFEVDLKLMVTSKEGAETLFHIELLYGGLFQITGVPEEHLEPVLLIECPRFLFPFARRIIGDLTTDGGFPPFMLEPLDFASVYQARLQAQAQQNVPSGTVTVQ